MFRAAAVVPTQSAATAVVSRLSLLIGLVLIGVGLLAPTISG
jgi:hypothetical protein